MADSDTDNLGSLLKDIDDMDDELFGRKKDGKHAAPKKSLVNIDDLFGDSQKGKKSKKNIDDFFSTKKPTVSFLDELDDDGFQEREKTATSAKSKSPEHQSNMKSVPTYATAGDRSTKVSDRTGTDMNDIFGPAPSYRRGATIRSGRATENNTTASNSLYKGGENERFYGPNRPRTSQKSPPLEISGYDRTQRLENEIDRLNREIDALKHQQSEREEALGEEWKVKLKRKEKQHEEELADLEESQRKQLHRLKSSHEEELQSLRAAFHKQIEALTKGYRESKNYEEILKRADELTVRIDEVTTNFNNQMDKSNADRNQYLLVREQQLEIREERIKKEEEWLADEKRRVNELNMKLQSLYDNSEQNAIQEKWRIREERQKLNAEKEAFKSEQLKILDAAEKERIEIEISKSTFLRQQHDLIIRVMSAKSSLEAEKSAFDAQRDKDVTRIKVEAEQLDHKLKQVQNAEDTLQNTRRIYEQKYQQLVALERALVDECFELERCRKQMETFQIDIQKRTNQTQMAPLSNAGAPDFIVDPYTDERRPDRR